MYPLDLRNRLYALFRAALGRPKAAEAFLAGVRPLLDATLPGSVRRAYLRDRLPRFKAVLALCASLEAPHGSWEREVSIGRLLYNKGLFFDCHEYLEELWRRSHGHDRRVVQGLIQAGAGFHKLELGSPVGCAKLLRLAHGKLNDVPGKGAKAYARFAARLETAAALVKKGRGVLGKAPRMGPGLAVSPR